MKLKPKQLAVIEFFQKQLGFWKHTSDIDSMTHYTDIGEELGVLHDDANLLPDEYDRIESVARILYQTIKGMQ